MKTTKALKLLTTSTLMASLIFANVTIPANAETYATLDDMYTATGSNDVAAEDTLTTNEGEVGTNNGTIGTNNGTVGDNQGSITNNADGATVIENNGNITTNNGTVVTNIGDIGTNAGTVRENAGTIDENVGNVGGTNDGTVINNALAGIVNGGMVTNNYGTAESAEVENNHGTAISSQVADNWGDGTASGADSIVQRNHGGTIGDDVEVLNTLPYALYISEPSDSSSGDDLSSSSSGSSSESSGSSAEVAGVIASPQVIVGGKLYKSTVSGAFITQNIAIAVVAPAAELKTKAGLGAGESLYFKGWEFTAKQSPLAYQALTDVAGSIGGNVLQCVELNFGKMTFGKFAELDESVVSRTTIVLPQKVDKNKKHALARAAKGGKTQILENFAEDPNVITSDIPGGAASYAIVEY